MMCPDDKMVTPKVFHPTSLSTKISMFYSVHFLAVVGIFLSGIMSDIPHSYSGGVFS